MWCTGRAVSAPSSSCVLLEPSASPNVLNPRPGYQGNGERDLVLLPLMLWVCDHWVARSYKQCMSDHDAHKLHDDGGGDNRPKHRVCAHWLARQSTGGVRGLQALKHSLALSGSYSFPPYVGHAMFLPGRSGPRVRWRSRARRIEGCHPTRIMG